MLITTNPLKRLRGKEALQQKWAETDRMLEWQRWGGSERAQDTMKDSPRRVGHPLPHTQLALYVSRTNDRLHMETSISDETVAGFYARCPDGSKRYVCSFQKGLMPEWSIIHTDRADLPVKEQRGWRTVLIRLLKGRYLNFNQVSEIVRDIYGYSPVDWNKLWHLHTRDFRT